LEFWKGIQISREVVQYDLSSLWFVGHLWRRLSRVISFVIFWH
jgi:hypothetical protein